MTEQDKLYIQSHRLWVKSTIRNIKSIDSEIKNCNRMIDDINEEIDIYVKRNKNDRAYLSSGQKSFGIWCHENGIDPDVILED